MTDTLYTRAAATALRMLTKYGRPMILRRFTEGAYAAGATTQTPADEPVQGLDLATVGALRPDTLIEGATGRFMLAASGMSAAPALADQLLVGDDVFAIKAVNTLDPGGDVPVIHELQVSA